MTVIRSYSNYMIFSCPFFFLNLVANQNTCSVSEEYTVDIHTVVLYLSMSVKWLPGLYPEAAVPTLLPRRRLFRLKLNLDTFRLGHLEADQLNTPACGKEPLE